MDAALSDLYEYDDLNQLTDFARGALSDSNSDGILDTVASPSRTQAWDLDAMGNWQSLSTNGTGQSRTHNAQNQVTGVGSATLAFDANGSMTTDQNGNTFVYDAWNRLVKAVDGSSVTKAEYAYDALGRRIVETRPVASTTDHLYYSTGWQVLEERRGGTSTSDVRRQYLWSIDYVDAMVARVDYASGTVTAKYNVTYDANWNVTTILVNSNSGASIQERYTYDPYGSVTILAPNGTVRSSSSYDWKYLHQTGRLDGDTGLYHFRNRDYSPTLGRWTRNDPIGFEAGDTNLYRYVGNGPVNGVDPSGLRERLPVAMGSNRGGPKNPGNDSNPNGRPVGPNYSLAGCWWECMVSSNSSIFGIGPAIVGGAGTFIYTHWEVPKTAIEKGQRALGPRSNLSDVTTLLSRYTSRLYAANDPRHPMYRKITTTISTTVAH